MRLLFALLLAAVTGCLQLEPEPDPRAGGLVEPDVFDVIRASNSKAAVEQLRDRHQQEIEHARLLEARIGELIAAEEGLAHEHRERLADLQRIKDQLKVLADEHAATTRALEALKQENAELEKAIAAERARQDELKKQAGGGS